MISIIAALAKNGVIGKDNQLPWGIKKDMKRFKKLTLKKPVIMGRKTYKSIGKPLPDRINIILTRKKNLEIPGCKTFNSIKKVLEFTKEFEETFVIGGDSIYKQFLPLTKKMYLTIIDKEFGGDTYFPDYNNEKWKKVEEENFDNFKFITLEKK